MNAVSKRSRKMANRFRFFIFIGFSVNETIYYNGDCPICGEPYGELLGYDLLNMKHILDGIYPICIDCLWHSARIDKTNVVNYDTLLAMRDLIQKDKHYVFINKKRIEIKGADDVEKRTC